MILFEVLLFASVLAMLFATQLDTTYPRLQSTATDANLYETLPLTTLSLVLLLFVT